MICCVTFWYYSLWTHTASRTRENVLKWTFKKYSQVLFEKIQEPCFPLKQQKKLLTETPHCKSLTFLVYIGWCFQIEAVLLQHKNVRLQSCCFSTSSLLTPSSTDTRLLSSSDSSEASLWLLASCSDTSSWRSSTWACSCCEWPRATSTSRHASANWTTAGKKNNNICLSTHKNIKLKTLQAQSEVQQQSII